jgi:molybdopterin/thiamine biosynthesis adenylyltransferase
MALADFHTKAIHSLLHAFRAKDYDTVLRGLKKIKIALVFDDYSLILPNTQLILTTAINLLSRLYPKIGIIYKGNKPHGVLLLEKLKSQARFINPKLEFVRENDIFEAALSVGSTHISAGRVIFMSADGWNIEISKNEPANLLLGENYNPISATGVAAFGVAEMFGFVFRKRLRGFQTENKYVFSYLTYKNTLSKSTPFPDIFLKDFTLFAAGAVGSAAIWCLSKIPRLSGNIDIVDSQTVELSNLQRYILTSSKSLGKQKAEMAKEILLRPDLKVSAHSLSFERYVGLYRQDSLFDTIAIASDNSDTRFSAQALLPRIALNAYTDSGGRVGASRHRFDSEQACLACLYISKKPSQSKLSYLSELTGFSHNVILKLLYEEVPLTDAHIRGMCQYKHYPKQKMMNWVGKSIDELYHDGICGGRIIDYIDESGTRRIAHIPLAHQSVLAGTVLAAEICKNSLGLISYEEEGVEISFTTEMLPPYHAVFRRSKSKTPPCICSDKMYVERYKEKYQ